MAKKKCDPKPAPLVKCLICGETLKVTKWRKHLARFHDEVDDPNFRDFFVILKHLSRSKIKCRLCDQVITLTDWEYHLRVKHGLKNDLRLKEFYIGQDSSPRLQINRGIIHSPTKIYLAAPLSMVHHQSRLFTTQYFQAGRNFNNKCTGLITRCIVLQLCVCNDCFWHSKQHLSESIP